ncbi:hypothetical protein KIPE111705_21165 [Kibdelosporangium persicum]
MPQPGFTVTSDRLQASDPGGDGAGAVGVEGDGVELVRGAGAEVCARYSTDSIDTPLADT